MLLDKLLSKDQLHEIFEEQKAVFSSMMEEGEKYDPKSDFYISGKKVATLTYPRFADTSEMTKRFHQAAWFPKLIRADETILFLDVTAEVLNSKNGTTMDSDVFLCIQTSPQMMRHEAAPYYQNPDVKYPVWNTEYELTEDNVFSLQDIIGSLNFAITDGRHNLDVMVTFDFLKANGFEIDFHFPFSPETFAVLEGDMFF